MLGMFLKHLLTKVCIDLVDATVFPQVSDPYKSTDLSLVVNILNFVLVLKALLLQTGLKMENICCAFFFLVDMSSSVPPDVLTILPR